MCDRNRAPTPAKSRVDLSLDDDHGAPPLYRWMMLSVLNTTGYIFCSQMAVWATTWICVVSVWNNVLFIPCLCHMHAWFFMEWVWHTASLLFSNIANALSELFTLCDNGHFTNCMQSPVYTSLEAQTHNGGLVLHFKANDPPFPSTSDILSSYTGIVCLQSMRGCGSMRFVSRVDHVRHTVTCP